MPNLPDSLVAAGQRWLSADAAKEAAQKMLSVHQAAMERTEAEERDARVALAKAAGIASTGQKERWLKVGDTGFIYIRYTGDMREPLVQRVVPEG